MKILTPGHKYELANLEPNKGSNDVSAGLRKEAYELCHLIEACGASPELTAAVTAAAALGDKIGILENGNQTIQFIEKQPVPDEPGKLVTVNNGTTNEEVLKMLIDRMQSLYDKFPSEETACSISHLKSALYAQQSRTYDRSQRGVEGKHLK